MRKLIQFSTLIDKLNTMPIDQLSAIYNAKWREKHNDIDVEQNKTILEAIELVCGFNNIEITGRGGSYEFTEHDRTTQ